MLLMYFQIEHNVDTSLDYPGVVRWHPFWAPY